MKYFYTVILALFLTFTFTTLFAQEQVISPNSRYFAITSFETTTKDTILIEKKGETKEKVINYYLTQIDIFQLRSLSWIRSLQVKSRKKLKIKEMGFSYGGKTFFVKTKKQLNIWDVNSGDLVYSDEGDNIFTFSNFSDFFLIFKNQKLTAYNNKTGDRMLEYKFSKSKKITKLEISKDDKYIIASAEEELFYFYEVGNPKSKKRYRGKEYRFIKNENKLTILRKKEDKFYNYIYSLPEFERINYFRGYSKSETLSPNGKYLAALVKRGSVVDKVELEFDALKIYDTETGFLWSNIIDTDTLKLRLKHFSWLKKDLISFDQENSSSLFSIASDRMVIDLDYVFSFENNNLSVNRQMQSTEVSNNKRYVAFQDYKGQKPVLYLKASAILGSKAFCPNVEFIDFTPNSKYIIVKQKSGGYGMIRTSEIEAIKDSLSEIKLYKFSDVLKLPIPEKEIDEDGTEPENYVYYPINDLKHISSVPEDELVNLYLKTIEVTDSHTGLQVHIMDKEGTYYYGASEYKWRHIWKNLLLQDEHGKIEEITNFRVSEYSSRDNLPTALAIVMDHSGSMGEARAKTLQKGAQILIDKKEKFDALTLIKYDSNIGVEVPLSKTEKRLKKQLKLDGLGKYGGATSILDAIDRAVSVLKNAKGYKRKAVILLTDGNENSSLISKGQMLKSASANDVGIFTIGFGDFVSEEYLKALAFYTQGSFYQIYKTADFSWVFDDVYKKMRNYYSIRFETDTIGVYTALLQIELDENRKDELATTFNNTPFDFDLLDESDFDYDFKAPISEIKSTEFVMRDLTEYRDSVITIEQEIIKQEKLVKIKQQKEDFSKIKLPNIQFVYSEVRIVETSKKGIAEIVFFMKKYPSAKLKISGHTDNLGDENENKELSLARAKAVKKLLVKRGVNGKRIAAEGYGDKHPIKSNDTEEGREENRRVEFKIIND